MFYVSPYIEMAMRYHFRVLPPQERVRLRILETDREGPLLAATFNGRRRALTQPSIPTALNPHLASAKSRDYTSPALSARGKD